MLCNKSGMTEPYPLNFHLVWTCRLLATAFFMEALCSNVSTQISVSRLIIYFCGKQPCNKQHNVHSASSQNKDVHYPLLIIILIQVIKDFESVTVISVEHYCKVNPACFTCLKMINSWKCLTFIKVIKCNKLHYFNKVIEKLHYLLYFK